LISAAGAQAATTTTPAYTKLTLVNGWVNYGSGTANAAVASINGIVHLKGAIVTNGINRTAFILPLADRPSAEVTVPVDMCSATNGRLDIAPSGAVMVEAEGNAWSNAQCLVSLDGVTFATSASSFTPLTLQNGWTWGGYGTAGPAARAISGVVHLEGSISSGTGVVAFTLPAGFRPAHDVNVKVDLCGAHNGALYITPAGQVNVLAFGTNWTSAQCFTSLDGVSFAR